MYDLCFEGGGRWRHFLLVIMLLLLAAEPPKAHGNFLGDTKAVLTGCEDHWTLQDRVNIPQLFHMTVCVDIRVVVPGAWVAFSYSSIHAPKPELGLEGDDEALYGWLLRVKHRFPLRLAPFMWHRVCLRRDIQRNSFSLEVDGELVSERTVIANAIPPSTSLWLGCHPQNRRLGPVNGEIELYLFRMWADLSDHGFCEDGTVIGWNAKYWGVTSLKARQRDPYLLCDHRRVRREARDKRSVTNASTLGVGRIFSPPPEVPATTPSSPVIATPVAHTSTLASVLTGSSFVNCDISSLCSDTNAYFWMSVTVEAEVGDKTEQDVHQLVSSAFGCPVTGLEDFCQDDGQLQVAEVNCKAKSNIRQTTCDVLLQLSRAVSACELQLAGVSALQQAGDEQIQARITGEVERVGRDLCEDMLPSSGGFMRCTSSNSLEDICQANKPSKLTCSVIEPNSDPVLHTKTDSCSSVVPRYCDCNAFCETASQFYAIRIGINRTSVNIEFLKMMLLGRGIAGMCNDKTPGSFCQDFSKYYKRAHLDCHGTQKRLYSCMVILEMSGPVDGCSLRTFLHQVIDKRPRITIESPLTRMMVCGSSGLTVQTLLASNFTWVASDLQTTDVCQPDPTLLKCEPSESLAVLLTDSCTPEPLTTQQSTNLTNNNITTTPGTSPPPVTNTTGQTYTTDGNTTAVPLTNVSQATAQPNMTTPLTTVDNANSSTTAVTQNTTWTTADSKAVQNTTLSTNTTLLTTTEAPKMQNTTTANKNVTDIKTVAPENTTSQSNTTAFTDTTLKTSTVSPNDTTVHNVTTARTSTPSLNDKTVNNITTPETSTMSTNQTTATVVTTPETFTTSVNSTSAYNVTTADTSTQSPSNTTGSNSVRNNTFTTPPIDTTINNVTTIDRVTPSPSNTTIYNVTTANPLTTSPHDTTINNVTTADTLTPPPNDTAMSNVTTAVTPTSSLNVTTINNVTTAITPTSSPNVTTINNVTTASTPTSFTSGTTVYNVTTADTITPPPNDTTNNVTTANPLTPSPSDTTVYNVTTAEQSTHSPSNTTRNNSVITTSFTPPPNVTTTNNVTTANPLTPSPSDTTVNNVTSAVTFTSPNETTQPNVTTISNTIVSTATPSPNNTSGNNFTTAANNHTTENSVTAANNNRTLVNSSFTSNSTNNSFTPTPNNTVTYNSTSPTNNHTTVSSVNTTQQNSTIDGDDRNLHNGSVTTSSPTTSMFTASPNHTVGNNVTTPNASTPLPTDTTLFNVSTTDSFTPSPNHTTVYNVTTAANNHTTVYDLTTANNNVSTTTVNSTLTPFTATPNNTVGFNATTLPNNHTTVYNFTTANNNVSTTTVNSTITPFTATPNNTIEFNATTLPNNHTTASNNFTTVFNLTTAETNVTLINSSTPTMNTTTISPFTTSPNTTVMPNVTTATINNTTTAENTTATTVSHNVTTTHSGEIQQNTTVSQTNVTEPADSRQGNETTTTAPAVGNITEPTVAPTNNQTQNHTLVTLPDNITNQTDTNSTAAPTDVSPTIDHNTTTGINMSSTTSSSTPVVNSTTNEPGVHSTTTASNVSTTSTTTIAATTPTLVTEINNTTAQLSTTSATTLGTTTLTSTTTTKPGDGTTTMTTVDPNQSQEEQANLLLNQTQNAAQLDSSQVEQAVGQLENLLEGPTVSESVGGKAINIVANLMEGDSAALSGSSNRLIQVVDDLGLKLVVNGDRAILSSNSLVLAVRTVDGTNFPATSVNIFNTDNVQLRANRRSRSKRSDSALGSVSLPSSLTSGLSPEQQLQANRLQFTFYTKPTLFQDTSLNNRTLVSPVLGSSVSNLSISNLRENVQFTIRNINPIHENHSASCVFWDITQNGGRGGWSSDGCFVLNTTAEKTICSCNHLTAFAILLDLSREGLVDRQHAQILTFITYIGCGISAIFLAVTLLTYLAFDKLLRDIPAKILVQLCMSLFLLNLVYLLDGWLALYPAVGLCISTAFFLHYFLLTSFTWAGLEALHLYLSVIKVFTPYLSRYMLKFSLMGWGIPLIVVIIVIAVDKDNYGLVTYGRYTDGTSDDFCWLRNDIAFYVGVVAYFLLIFSLCLVVFIMVMVQLARIKKQNPQNQAPNRSMMTDLRSIAGLVILLGLTWGFALFAWGPLYLPFVYLFSIFNSLQGFLVFIFHCAIKENVRKQWRTYLCCGRLRLAENSDWSRTATQNNRNSSHATASSLAPPFTSRSSSVTSDATQGSDSVFLDSGISDGSSSDVVLNEIHRRNQALRAGAD